MKSILSILTAVVLLISSFTFSSCKDCNSDENRGKGKDPLGDGSSKDNSGNGSSKDNSGNGSSTANSDGGSAADNLGSGGFAGHSGGGSPAGDSKDKNNSALPPKKEEC
jgi:hypothetical protein